MINFLKRQLGHDAHPMMQFIKYGVIGVMVTAFHTAIFYVAGYLFFPCFKPDDIVFAKLEISVTAISEETRMVNAAICNAIGFIPANVTCYILNRLFVFKSGRHHCVVEFLLFFSIAALCIVIATATQSALIKYLHMQTTFAFLINITISLVINFAMRKFVIFKG